MIYMYSSLVPRLCKQGDGACAEGGAWERGYMYSSLLIKSLISSLSRDRGVIDTLPPLLSLRLPLPRLDLLLFLSSPTVSTAAGVRATTLLSLGRLGPVSGTPVSLSSRNCSARVGTYTHNHVQIAHIHVHGVYGSIRT